MDMQRISSGKLRAIGYDRGRRALRVELDDGRLLEYSGVGEEIWRRLQASASPWSTYRDAVEEEFSPREVGAGAADKKHNPLDDLFRP